MIFNSLWPITSLFLYATENHCVENDLIATLILSLASSDNKCMLTNLPIKEEVRLVFAMNGYRASSLDGFGGSFFQAF